MSETQLETPVDQLTEILREIKVIAKQTKLLQDRVTQLLEYQDLLQLTAIRYGIKTDEIHVIYSEIYDKLAPLFNMVLGEKNQRPTINDLRQAKELFEKARIEHYKTQLVIPPFQLKEPT